MNEAVFPFQHAVDTFFTRRTLLKCIPLSTHILAGLTLHRFHSYDHNVVFRDDLNSAQVSQAFLFGSTCPTALSWFVCSSEGSNP